MTAYATVKGRMKGLEAGMADYITKPIHPDELISSLVKWIEPGVREIHFPPKAVSEDTGNGDFPETLPGIDLKDGLARVSGNQGFFRQLLVKFSVSHKNTVEEILSALESKDSEKAIRLAHTLKGLAGTIGAHELQAAAADLEAAVTDKRKELHEYNL